MGDTKPLTRGEKKDRSEEYSEEIGTVMTRRQATAVVPNLPTSFPEKLRGIVGMVGGGRDTEREEQVHAA